MSNAPAVSRVLRSHNQLGPLMQSGALAVRGTRSGSVVYADPTKGGAGKAALPLAQSVMHESGYRVGVGRDRWEFSVGIKAGQRAPRTPADSSAVLAKNTERQVATVTSIVGRAKVEPASSRGTAAFGTWLDTFVSEKGLDTEYMFEVQGSRWGTNFIPASVVIESAKKASPQEQALIKDTLVKIDFRNGDPMHYFKHLATCLARAHG